MLTDYEKRKQFIDSWLSDHGPLSDDDARFVLGQKRLLGQFPSDHPEHLAALDKLHAAATAEREYRKASRPKVRSTVLREEVSVPGGYEVTDADGVTTFVPVDMSPEGRAQRIAAREEAEKSQVPDGRGGVMQSEKFAAIIETVEARRPLDIHSVLELDGAELRQAWKVLPEDVKAAILQQASKFAPMGTARTRQR